MQRYLGVVSVRASQAYGFVGRSTVTKDDGSPFDLRTSKDIYVHEDDCGGFKLADKMRLSFEIVPDEKRGGDAMRAVDVVEYVVGELVSAGARQLPALTENARLYVPPTPAQCAAIRTTVDHDDLRRVLRNKPFASMPRNISQGDAKEITDQLLRRIFPGFDPENPDMSDEELERSISQTIADYESIGMEAKVLKLESHIKTFKRLRTLQKEDLLTPHTAVPIQYLPDLFMAVPVWYFWANARVRGDAKTIQHDRDPMIHDYTRYICDLLPNDHWIDTFLMFNRRLRTLADYEGESIPKRTIERMRHLAPLFDHMVIMTPYHDVAGQDWEDPQWLRSIDPYVVGFVTNVPLMFVVDRFSGSGIYPLHTELVADTLTFLRTNIERLRGFEKHLSNPYWYRPGTTSFSLRNPSSHLIRHTRQLLAVFERGYGFDWLRAANEPARKSWWSKFLSL